MDCIVHGVTKSQTWLSDFCFLFWWVRLWLQILHPESQQWADSTSPGFHVARRDGPALRRGDGTLSEHQLSVDSNCLRPAGDSRSLGSWFSTGFSQWKTLVGNWLVGGARVFFPLPFTLSGCRDCISSCLLLLLVKLVFKFQLLPHDSKSWILVATSSFCPYSLGMRINIHFLICEFHHSFLTGFFKPLTSSV